MRIGTMRALDYYIGMPLCFLASWYLKLKSRSHETQLPQKVLFIELSEMGSAILADPAMRWIGSQKTQLFFVIFKSTHESLFLLKTVDANNIFLIRDNNILVFAIDFLRFLFWTRKKNIDTVIDLELFSRVTSLMTALSGAQKRVGFYSFFSEGLYRGEVLTRKVLYNPHIHIAKNFMALVKSCYEPFDQKPFFKGYISDVEIALHRAPVSSESHERVRQILASLKPQESTQWVLLNCGGGPHILQRRWPAESYVELAKLILKYHVNVHILLTGKNSEAKELDVIRTNIKSDRVTNFAACVEFEDLPALYQSSCLMVTNDSGAAHFASTTSLPTFVFFGPETPSLYGPLGNFTALYSGLACSPCVSATNHRQTSCRDNKCLQTISPVQVYRKIAPAITKASTISLDNSI